MVLKADKYSAITALIGTILFLVALARGASIIFTISIIVFVAMMLYCYRNFEERIVLFAFGIAFFTFLMGREFLEQFFRYKIENYESQVNIHTYICLLLSLIAIWIAYGAFERRRKKKGATYYVKIDDEDHHTLVIRRISIILFYASIPVAIGIRLLVARYVQGASYYDYYTDFSEYFYGNTILYYISRIEYVVPVSLGIFCATLPKKKEARAPLFLYFVYLVLSLGGGNRGTCILGLIYIFVFIVYMQGVRPEEKWFKRKYILFLLLMFPVLAMLSSVISMSRSGQVDAISMYQAFVDFFYDQGVSITVIKHAYELADQIPKQGPYLLEFLHSGVLARILGIAVYHGNTVEHAMHGGSFTHAYSYTIMGSVYLSGRGAGSSYLAELFFDLGYFGVVAGNVLYGYIFASINRFSQKNIFTRALIFTLLTQFFWAPRGSYTGFIGFVFTPTTILTFMVVWGLANLLRNWKNR